VNVGRRWLPAATIVVVGAFLSLAIACSDDSNDGGDNGGDATATEVTSETPSETIAANEVHISEMEYAIENLDGGDLPSPTAGEVTFEVHNDGEIVHEFVIIKTDLPEASLPVDGTTVDENATGVDVVDEIEEFDAGTTEVLSVGLEAGNYVLICNVATHYDLGMHATLTVQ